MELALREPGPEVPIRTCAVVPVVVPMTPPDTGSAAHALAWPKSAALCSLFCAISTVASSFPRVGGEFGRSFTPNAIRYGLAAKGGSTQPFATRARDVGANTVSAERRAISASAGKVGAGRVAA